MTPIPKPQSLDPPPLIRPHADEEGGFGGERGELDDHGFHPVSEIGGLFVHGDGIPFRQVVRLKKINGTAR